MSEFPSDLRYTNDHEWVRPAGDSWRIGITAFAANQLGDVVMVELPKVGDLVTKGQVFGSIESVKSVSELFAPVSGRVSAVNEGLQSSPENVNNAPYGDGWLIEIQASDASEKDDLMDSAAYGKFTTEE
jgi:glycine cleavage system H protein